MVQKIVKKNLEGKEGKKPVLVLLDAHAIIHRAYHALPDFATSKGEPTGALYGLCTMVMKIITELKPDYIVAAYDLPKPTYRHEVYEGYKSGRSKTDDALVLQLEKSKEVCDALNIPIYSKEGFEADDMLGTIVEQLKGKDIDIIIASGDMDTLQLIEDGKNGGDVKVYTLKKGINDTILYDKKLVKERFGFGPELLPDYKGLRGDPSDNIIGIVGIGEKTATDLIVNFGSIESIYKKLEKNSEEFEKLGIKKRVVELLKENKEEAEFSKMLATIRRDAPIEFTLPDKIWREGVAISQAEKLFNGLEFRTMGTKLREVINKNGGSVEVSSGGEVEEDVDKEILEETKIALWVVDSNITDPSLSDILFFAKKKTFKEAREIIFKELENRESNFVFEKIEKPLMPVVERMEKRGVLVDALLLRSLEKEYKKDLAELEKKIWKLVGEEFNVASPKQLGMVLFDKLGLSVKNHKKTGGGQKSTKESELVKMKDLHPSVPLILEHRELSKLIGTYIEPIPTLLDKESRLHARFLQAGSTTGRMSSQNPNLQNIPISSERGRVIRNCFIAPKGFKLVSFDYSQIELRIAAFLSCDEKLINIFKNKEDIHTSVASYVFGVPQIDVTKDMRRQAKVINFGILYGMGVNALKENLGADRKTAQEFYNRYFAQFKELANFIEKTKAEAAQLGYTKTFFGRRRYFEGIKSSIPFIRASAERMAFNAPIQGTEADIIKLAMVEINSWIKKNGFEDKVYLVLQIHDELVYEIKEELVEKAEIEIKKIMEGVMSIKDTEGVPILADSSVGDNLGKT